MLYDDAYLARIETALRQALPVWGIAPDAPLGLLAISENATFRSWHPERGKVVLRVQRPGYNSAEEIRSELQWVSALRAAEVVHTAAPLPTLDGALMAPLPGTGMLVAAFDFLEGVPPDETGDLPRWFHEIGVLTARLHDHARNWRRPRGFHRRTWDWRATISESADWGDWRDAPGIGLEGRPVMERTVARLRDDLAAYGTCPARFGLIHADVRPDNLLVHGDRMGVIDFDDCGMGWFLYDFAASVSLMEHEPFMGDLREAWLSGYGTVAQLTAADRAMIPAFVLLRRIQLTAWGATHAETPTGARAGRDYARGTVELAEGYLAKG